MIVLDQFLITEFVKQVKATLATEDRDILDACSSASTWAYGGMVQPEDMDWPEFNAYCEFVGGELITEGVLKVDERWCRGKIGLRVRLSKEWYDAQQDDSRLADNGE